MAEPGVPNSFNLAIQPHTLLDASNYKRELRSFRASSLQFKMPLTYTPLDPTRSEIRLLELLHSTTSINPIRCRIHTVSLKDILRYNAVSYVWGDRSNPLKITVDDSEVLVTQNLFYALKSLVRYVQPLSKLGDAFYLWVDAICIDQNNMEEKATQVPLMRDIYETAFAVFAFVGSTNTKITTTMEALEEIRPLVEASIGDHTLGFDWMEECPQLWTSDDGLQNEFWDGLEQFLTLEYWSRVWILQEVVLASHLFFIATNNGSTVVMSFDALEIWNHFISMVEGGSLQRPKVFPEKLWALVTRQYRSGGVLSCVFSIRAYRERLVNDTEASRLKMTNLNVFNVVTANVHATNPKDEIYGLLGVMDLDIEIDYSDSLTVRTIYTRFAELCFAAGRGSSLLSSAGIGWNENYINPFNLPSWVPDRHTQGYGPESVVLMAYFGVFSANAGMDTSLWTVTPNGSLLVPGCVCEIVQHHVFQPTTKPSDQAVASFEFCARFTRSRNAKPGKSRMTPLQMLFRTLLRDLCPINQEFRDSANRVRLYSERVPPAELLQYARTFLYCVTYFNDNADEELNLEQAVERIQQLGYDPKSESFVEFLLKQFLPQAKIRAEAFYTTPEGERVPLSSIGGSVAGDNSKSVTESEETISRNLSQLRLALGTYSFASNLESLSCIGDSVVNFGLVELSDGRPALVPPESAIGDYICALNPCEYPVVLRRHGSSYKHIGACFVIGLMDGEAVSIVDAGKTGVQQFEII
jgi:Heterokaryon incompatibility protein (HET)